MRADLALLAVVAVWGLTFVAVDGAVRLWPPFVFLAARFALAVLTLVPFALRRARVGWRPHLLPGCATGAVLFAGYALQTWGQVHTTPAKAAFVTGLSVVLVPACAGPVLGQRIGRATVAGVILATAGLFLLCLREDLRMGVGDLLVLGCAFAFAAHILLVGRFSPRLDPLRFTAVQLGTAAGAAALAAVVLDLPKGLPALHAGVLAAVAFTGILATSVAFAVQSWAQRHTSATHVAMLFGAEPVFGALASWLLVGESFTLRMLAGCACILLGMLAAELGDQWLARRRSRLAAAARVENA